MGRAKLTSTSRRFAVSLDTVFNVSANEPFACNFAEKKVY